MTESRSTRRTTGRLLLLLVVLPGTASAETAPADSPWTSRVVIEERELEDGTRLVLCPDAALAAVAVCVRKEGTPPPDLGVTGDLGLRGTTVRAGESSWCVAVPRDAARAALSAAARVHGLEWRPAGSTADAGAGQDPRSRVEDLVLEGVERDRSPGGSIAVVGGESLETAIQLVESVWGKSRPRGPARPSPLISRQTTERLSVLAGVGERPRLDLGWAVPNGTAEDAAALAVAAEIWAADDRGRLARLLTGGRGLSRGSRSWWSHLPGGRILGMSLELTSRATVDRVLRFVDGSLRRLRLSLPSSLEVRSAVARLERRALESWEQPLTRAELLSVREYGQGDARAFLSETASLRGVTAAAVRRAAAGPFVNTRRASVETYPRNWPPDDPKLQGYALYTAEEGDTLESIAVRYGTTIRALSRANDFDPRHSLGAGQGIWVPR